MLDVNKLTKELDKASKELQDKIREESGLDIEVGKGVKDVGGKALEGAKKLFGK